MTEVDPGSALPSSSRLVRTLGGVAMLSGFLVVLTYQLTLPAIQENQRLAIERAVFRVIPGATMRLDFRLDEQGLQAAESKEASGVARVYAGYDAEGVLRGVALEAAAQGYQDVIKLLYGYDPACRCITGLNVLKMTETPGLGDKIAFDPAFLRNFEALDARLNAQGTNLEHAIVAVKHGRKHAPWEIDAISGATVSSKAVGKALDGSARRLLPLLLPHLDLLGNSGRILLESGPEGAPEDAPG